MEAEEHRPAEPVCIQDGFARGFADFLGSSLLADVEVVGPDGRDTVHCHGLLLAYHRRVGGGCAV